MTGVLLSGKPVEMSFLVNLALGMNAKLILGVDESWHKRGVDELLRRESSRQESKAFRIQWT